VLLAAGTILSWNHLCDILKATKGVEKLSWSWDNTLEDDLRRAGPESPFKKPNPQLTRVSEELLQLKSLLIHVPMPYSVSSKGSNVNNYNPHGLPSTLHQARTRSYNSSMLVYSYSGLEFMISMCLNIEELCLLSWPKTSHEYKSSIPATNTDNNIPDNGFRLPKLKKLYISVKQWARMTTRVLVQQLIESLKDNAEAGRKPEVLWVDHPVLDLTVAENMPRGR
jgi:hypothetical protein